MEVGGGRASDAYVSIRDTRRRIHGDASRPRAVIFVDLDSDNYDQLRHLPPVLLGQRQATLLVRLRDEKISPVLPGEVRSAGERIGLGGLIAKADGALAGAIGRTDPGEAKLKQLLQRWKLSIRVGLVFHPLGAPAQVKVLQGPALKGTEERDLLNAARAVEMEALLRFGNAIWEPSGYHYRLPSGEHAPSYIKVADAVREPRDAAVLATWLLPHMEPRIGMVLDSGTLTPVAQAVQLRMAQTGWSMGPIATLDQYPRAAADVDEALDRASGDGGKVLVVLSVSSTGSLLERIDGAISRKGSTVSKARVSIMVSKDDPDASPIHDVWNPLKGEKPLAPKGHDGEQGCRWCQEWGRSTLIPINPFSFDGMLPSQVRRLVPSLQDPTRNRSFWEIADECEAVGLEQEPHTDLHHNRAGRGRMSMVVRVEEMLANEGFRKLLIDRLRADQKEGLSNSCSLLLVPAHEMACDGFDDFWQAIRHDLAPQVETPTPFPLNDSFGQELDAQVREASEVLVFCLGTVTGASLQRALVGIQAARNQPGEYLQGFVVHARPATQDEWRTLGNSYGRREGRELLHYGWLSFLPEESPLKEEAGLLKWLATENAGDQVIDFVEGRLRAASEGVAGDHPVFWGAEADRRVTPNSIYGQLLRPASVYVAVASAIASARSEAKAKAAPELRVFDMAAMTRSYYDPLIICAFLRWLRPYEIWWGWNATEASTTVTRLLSREGDMKAMLVAELLLAGAQGKLTPAGKQAVRASVQGVRATAPDEVEAALATGELLLEQKERNEPK